MTANAVEEIKAIFERWPIWFMLGTQDIKMRYRRSSIGPFWITISMAVTIYSMGFLYGHLFKIELAHYFPFLATGIIGWALVSSLILESSNAFIESEPYIRNQESYLSLFITRLILRNLIIFAHNVIVFLPIALIFHTSVNLNTLLLLPGLIIISLNALLWGSLLAVIGTRYRDFAQIITSLIQVIFFLTPIMWMPTLLPAKLNWVVMYNPFNQFLNLIRYPLLGQALTLPSILMITTVTLLGLSLYAYCLGKYKNRVVFWL
tara:strand:+ start:5210 stop:5995 length:786 start_codon:yes stop_codon:yes gene_type:complete